MSNKNMENSEVDLEKVKRIFFIGIGGIGMSALARYFHQSGLIVTGYDKTETVLTKKLVEEGIRISYVDQIEILDKAADLVVYTPAIPKDHLGWNWYQENLFPVFKRAEILGMISHYKKSICIAGTHGKTSTSSMVTYILRECGVTASAFIGGIPTDYGTNFLYGESDWVVMEADEYDRSFWSLSPNIASIASMDADHLDVYGSHDVMKEGFEGFIRKINEDGVLLIMDPLQKELSKGLKSELNKKNIRIKSLGIDSGEIQAQEVRVKGGQYVFDYVSQRYTITDLAMKMPGKHNVENALVAISIALERGCDPNDIRKAIGSFSGVKRRFEIFCQTKDLVMIDDYAHHPTELRMAIDAARNLYPGKKLTGIFQPHLFSRTQDFYKEFAEVLDELDECILIPVYPARELSIKGISSKTIYDELKIQNKYLVDKNKVLDHIKSSETEVLIVLGAGDIDALPAKLKELMKK